MHDRAKDDLEHPEAPIGAAAPSSTTDAAAIASSDTLPTIRYATDAEVDAAMEKIFQKHDRLFAELAK